MRAGITADRVARAGADLADALGFDAVTIAEVARHFDVQPASMYAHVKGSADLKKQIALLSLMELADRAADAVAGRAGRDALGSLADCYRDYAREHPGRYAATKLRLDRETAVESAGPRHTRLLSAALRAYHLDEIDETHAIRLFGSAVHGFITLEAAGGFENSSPHSDASWKRILDALDATFHNWPRH